MTYNYNDFDLSAFINSPMQTDINPMNGGNQQDTLTPALASGSALHNGVKDTQSDGTVFAGAVGPTTDWTVHSQQQQQMYAVQKPNHAIDSFPLDTHTQSLSIHGDSGNTMQVYNKEELDYCSRIAAHHSQQLRYAVPVPPTSTPDGRIVGGRQASTPALQRQAGRRALEPPMLAQLSLQERRRNARRALNQENQRQQQHHVQQQSQSTAALKPAHGAVAPTVSSGINTSGRSAKRGMSSSSGHIHGPKSTLAHQNANASTRVPLQSQEVPAAAKEIMSAVPIRNADQSRQTVNTAAVASRQAYATTGFDLLGALARVVLRPNPRILLGPIDLSASFTICDARHPEQPIVYCSDTFCELTGYSRSEILGRNCRFLQAPDGNVRAGSERYHTDNAAVLHLKQHSRAMQESQASLINYRKDGTPFINLVTVVPIPWGTDPNPVYLVGFQVDLVEQPSAVLQRAANGTYVVNYSSGSGVQEIPPNTVEEVLPAPTRDGDQEAAAREISVGKELAELIGSGGGGEEDPSRWARILLQHSQDLIHVLSLKGTFLYVSPSVERLLGWKPEELMGKSISDFCHPSDVVPVFRELKDSTSNASINAAAKRSFRNDGNTNRATKGGVGQGGPEVNLLMRMRHKTNGHIWVESKGKLHLEQGKGRKVVISSGRARPVYNLPWEPVKATVSSDNPAFWAKVSNDGLILSAAEGVESVIDGVDHSLLYGKHLHQMVNKEAMPALLEALRGVQVATVTHQMFNAVDEPVWVTSTMYPSAVMPGAHTIPTVFVHVALINPASDFLGSSKKNTMEAKDLNNMGIDATAESGGVPGSSVFGELDIHRSSSHIFELHSLKHANRRLREDLRSIQRRVGARQGIETAESVKNDSSTVSPVKAPLKEGFVQALDKQQEEAERSRGSTTGLESLQHTRASLKPTRPHLAPPRPSMAASSSSSSMGNSSSTSATSVDFMPVDRDSHQSKSEGNSSEETAPTSVSSGDSSEVSDPDLKKRS